MVWLKELTPFAKEALHQTVRIAKFFCCLHVTNTYLCTNAYVRIPLVPLCTTLLAKYFSIDPVSLQLVGPSMLPTFNDGDFVLAERVTTRLGKIGSGDLVLLRSPDNPRKIVTKRVKGVEGDVVSCSSKSDEQKTVVVPKGHVWVEGDNTEKSYDSREFGPVPCALLHARIFLKIWPPKDFGLVGNKVP